MLQSRLQTQYTACCKA